MYIISTRTGRIHLPMLSTIFIIPQVITELFSTVDWPNPFCGFSKAWNKIFMHLCYCWKDTFLSSSGLSWERSNTIPTICFSTITKQTTNGCGHYQAQEPVQSSLKQPLISKFAKSNRLVVRQRSWPKQLWKMVFWLETRRLTTNTIHKHCMLVGKDDSHRVMGCKFWNGFPCRVELISKCMVNGGGAGFTPLQTEVINTQEGGAK